MTNKEILKTAMAQSAIDSGCDHTSYGNNFLVFIKFFIFQYCSFLFFLKFDILSTYKL